MANKMLIDAAHPEETRVVVLRGNRVEEFDFKSASRKQLRGNIYLAKVTRVEPSLQAAFVDYGGNRHGFLAFSEIHPDYYQIPVADRQALIEEEERALAEADAKATEADDKAAAIEEARDGDAGSASVEIAAAMDGDAVVSEAPASTATTPETESSEAPSETSEPGGEIAASDEAEEADGRDGNRETELLVESAPALAGSGGGEEPAREAGDGNGESTSHRTGGDEVSAAVEVVSDDRVESVGAEDALEELPERRRPRLRQYKIQEVIKRRQVLLVQVVKEERGNKGAALTTYLSLAGRYCVLMPNTARGGGISRKITSPADRKRLKQLAADLEVPEGMGVILRTAGATRTKAEVKRDFEYLLRLWENVRELTLRSSAPTLVYEEGSLIKRSIRDLYNKDIDEILVAGEDAYREAKDFMRMLMPSHAKNVQPYRDRQPLFARSGIEAQLDAMFSPQVTLRSGGYLVINQTEALVAIDVNSGRSTREHNIEDTAHQTNLEASEEIARQLRLRDLAGLIVIDFIDMEEKRNNRAVERRLKEALKNDRARIQVGRISHFGLMEMSRQRIRTGVLESTTTACPVCQGSGHIRAPASVALHVLRSIEDQLLRGVTHHLAIRTRTAVALYILNQKRAHLSELEQRFGLSISVLADEAIANGAHFTVERGEPIEHREPVPTTVQPDSVQPQYDDHEPEPEPVVAADEEPEDEAFEEPEASVEREPPADGEPSERESRTERESRDDRGKRRRRRRRHRGEEADEQPPQMLSPGLEDEEESVEGDEPEGEEGERTNETLADADSDQNRKRRRGRRGGRRGRRGRGERGQGEAPNGDGGERLQAMPEVAYPTAEAAYPTPESDYRTQEVDYPTQEAAYPTPEAAYPSGNGHEPSDGPVANIEPPSQAEPREAAAPLASTSETARPRQPEEYRPAQSESARTDEVAGAAGPVEEPVPPAPPEPPPVEVDDPSRPKRGGWWQRRSFF